MANNNMNTATKWANYYGIECQLITGKTPLQCSKMYVKGIEYKTTTWNGEKFREFFEDMACGTDELTQAIKEYLNNSYMFEHIQFTNKPIINVLDQFVMDNMTVREWTETIKELDEQDRNEVIEDIDNRFVVLDDRIIERKDFNRLLNEYCRFNNIPMFDDELQERIIKEYIRLYD